MDEATASSYASRSGRAVLEKDQKTGQEQLFYLFRSVPEIEAMIQTALITLENLKPPSQYTPAVSKSAFTGMYTGPTSHQYVIETYGQVLAAFDQRKTAISETVSDGRALLSKIRNAVYTYVMSVNLQLRFENASESVFQETKERVDKALSKVCPSAMKRFVVAYERLKSSSPEEWSQALSSCRNILKDFANSVFPAQKEKYKKRDGTELDVTDDKYKNRLLAFLDRELKGGNRKDLLSARAADVESRIHALNAILSQGTHGDIGFVDVNICVLDTYLLLGSLLSITKNFDSPNVQTESVEENG
jgi:hypothetical protein